MSRKPSNNMIVILKDSKIKKTFKKILIIYIYLIVNNHQKKLKILVFSQFSVLIARKLTLKKLLSINRFNNHQIPINTKLISFIKYEYFN